MGFIQEHLVAHKELKEIEYAAVNGMLSTLDPHTILLEPKYFKEMKLQTRGEFGGLGFVIAMRDGNLTVVKVLKGTPAQRAGVKAKDVIQKIEEQSTINMDLQDAVDHLRGKPQTKVSITIARAGWPEPKRLHLTREVIQVETVPQAHLLEGNVGYVKLSQFSANTTRDLAGTIQEQMQESGGKLEGLVLDLRGNPGGLLEQAIQVSDLFLSEGVIVKTVGGGRQAADQRGEGGVRRVDRPHPAPARRHREQQLRLGERDRRRRPQEQQPRARRRAADLRQGLGPGAARLHRAGAAERGGRAEAHHRAVPHARGHLDPGGRHHARTSCSCPGAR